MTLYPLKERSRVGTIGWAFRQQEEIAAMKAFIHEQRKSGGVHTRAMPLKWEMAQEIGIDVQEVDVRMGVVWGGETTLFKNGRRLIIVVLPVSYPIVQPRLWIQNLATLACHRLSEQRRACLTIHEWSPERSIAGLLAEGLQAFAADVNGKKPIAVGQ